MLVVSTRGVNSWDDIGVIVYHLGNMRVRRISLGMIEYCTTQYSTMQHREQMMAGDSKEGQGIRAVLLPVVSPLMGNLLHELI